MATYNLNEMQQKIVNHTEGAIMVLAGAGSGKTSVLTQRIANIINQGFAYPSQILAITFTNKAASEMKERLTQICKDAEYIWAQTFHSFCAKLLRREISNLQGYNGNFSIYDESDKKQVLKKILKQKELKEDEYMQDLMHDISTYKNANISLEEYYQANSYKYGYETNYQIMKEYEQSMKQNNALDFDDLLIKTLELLKTNEFVRIKYQSNFRYILVDEFQDTNQVQYELVKILAQMHKNIFAVGDEDQSIYSWRGANVANIQKFLTDFKDATLYKLEQNYRSTKNIIECANKVIKHNQNRIDKTLFTENDNGIKVQYFNKYSDREEAEFVAGQIYNLVATGYYKYSDIAILMRMNALTRSFEDKLLSYDIPYRIFGGLKFYDRMEIKNVLAYLKLIINPKDNESFNRIVNFPKRNIGEMTVNKLAQSCYNQSLMEKLYSLSNEELQDKNYSKFAGFLSLMKDFKEKSTQTKVSEFVQYVIKKLDLERVFKTGKEEDENRINNLDELISSIEQFEKDNENITLEEYLQNVSLISDIDTYDDEQNTVTISTVHSAKGLEFKVVFIVGVEEKYFPIIRDYSTDADMEEERRLMYVAVTRAKERLYLTNASSRFMYGQHSYSSPSRFLAEMELVQPKQQIRSSFDDDYDSDYYSNNRFSRYSNDYSSGYSSYNSSEQSSNYGSSYSGSKPLFNSNYSKSSTTSGSSTLKQNQASSFKAGDKVEHGKFGQGTVVSFDSSLDILTVNFAGIGNKVLSAKFAPIKKVI